MLAVKVRERLNIDQELNNFRPSMIVAYLKVDSNNHVYGELSRVLRNIGGWYIDTSLAIVATRLPLRDKGGTGGKL